MGYRLVSAFRRSVKSWSQRLKFLFFKGSGRDDEDEFGKELEATNEFVWLKRESGRNGVRVSLLVSKRMDDEVYVGERWVA
jgi:hypothetical protein